MLHPYCSKQGLNASLAGIFGGGSPFVPNSSYGVSVGLFNAPPTLDSPEAAELSYGGYQRAQSATGATFFDFFDGPPPLAKNSSPVTFPTCTTNDNQVATHWGLFYAATAGGPDLLYLSGALDAPLVVSNSYTPVFGAGSIVVSGSP